MSTTHSPPQRPDETVRGTWVAVLPLIVPPLVWISALGLSWLFQEFTCSAAVSAGLPVPETALRVALLVMQGILLLLAVGAGLLSVRALRRGRRTGGPLTSFIGVSGITLAVLFGLGIVGFMVAPLVMEVC